jgi:HlyD family secretion protein
MQTIMPVRPETSLTKLILTGCLAVFVLVGILGGWSATTLISGAVVANGQVEVAGKPKTVQTLDGGVLEELPVRNGDYVEKGQLLARFDATLLQINLDIARSRLASALSLRARLEAERVGDVDIIFDYNDLPKSISDMNLAMPKAEAGQVAIFQVRMAMRSGSLDRMHGYLAELDSQSLGVRGQIKALEQQISLLDQDLVNITELVAKGLARHDRLTDAMRRHAVLQGELAGRRSELASLNNRRLEVALDASQDEKSFQEQIVTDLRALTSEIEELALSIVTRQAQLDRIEVRAPESGVVHEMQMTTVGGIIAPGGTLLDIVPQDAGFEFEVRVPAQSINKVHYNQSAQIVFGAFDQRNTPKLGGWVRSISPEAIRDIQTGQLYYRVALEIPQDQIDRLPTTAKLIPGMPLEAFLRTTERTVLSYLTEPLTAHLRHGFRE